MKVKIEIDTRTFVRFWLVVIGFGLVGLAIFYSMSALVIIGAALFFAIALSPSVNKVSSYLPSRSRVLSTAISYTAVIAVLGAVMFLAVPPIVEQFAKVTQSFPAWIDSASKQYSGLNDFIVNNHLEGQADKISKSISDSATKYISSIGANIFSTIGSAFSIFTAGILIIVLTFLMLVEGPVWLDRIWSVYNDNARMMRHKKLVKKMYGVVTGYVIGQLSVSAIAGTVSLVSVFILCLIFGMPANLVIPAATIIFIFSLIPLFGETLGNLLVTLLLLMNNLTAAVIFLIFFILYQQLEANYIAPMIQSKRNNLSALAILVAVTIGIYLFGIIGAIISIPIAGCIRILTEDYFSRMKKARESNDPVSIK